MFLVSQNLTNYMSFADDAVIRINLAWVENLVSLEKTIRGFDNDIYLDLPIGRTKPPNNSYSVEDLSAVIGKYSNIKYLAISNVESSGHINSFVDMFGHKLSIVPKIETKKGIDNIDEICSALNGERIIMLDHDDLFSDLIKLGIPSSDFFSYISKLSDFCAASSVSLLKTRGVIFSDQDEYEYNK